MSNPIDDGGPAFPRDTKWNTDGTPCQNGARGMSLRDWFAGQAIHTAWADLARSEDAGEGDTVGTYELTAGDDVFTCAKYTAIRAYEIADAMLAARKEKP